MSEKKPPSGARQPSTVDDEEPPPPYFPKNYSPGDTDSHPPTQPKPAADASATQEEATDPRKRYASEPLDVIEQRAKGWPVSVERYLTLLWVGLLQWLSCDSTPASKDEHLHLLDHVEARAEKETYLNLDITTVCRIRGDLQHGNLSNAFNMVNFLLSSVVRPFSVHRTAFLVNETRAYARDLRGQKILVFLGRSGAGKSTTLLYFTGHEMVQRDNAHRDIGPAPGSAPEEFKTNGNPESETAYVRGIPISQEYLKHLGVRNIKADGTVIGTDTPGVGDNGGAETDVANIIGINIALKSCESFWPVVVLSGRDGNNFEQSKDTLKVVSRLFQDITAVSENLTFLFTKFDKDAHDSIHSTFSHLLGQAEENLPQEDPFRNILAAVFAYLDDYDDGREIVLPLDSSRVSKHLKNILKKRPVRPSNLSGRVSLLASSENTIAEQLHLSMACIRFALEHEELGLVVQRLQEMELLASTVPSDRIALRLAEARELVLDFLKSKFEAATERINEFKDASTGTIAIDVLGSLDAVASSARFLQKTLPDLNLEAVTSECSSTALADLCSALKEGAISTKPLTPHERLNQLNKLRVLCERVPAVEPSVYREATNAIATQVRDTQHLATKMLQGRKLCGAGEVASRALAMAEHFAAHLIATNTGGISGAEINAAASSRSSSDSSLTTQGEVQEEEQGKGAERHGLSLWRETFVKALLSEVEVPVDGACRALASLDPLSVETRGDDVVAKVKAALDLMTEVQRLHQLTGVLGPEVLQGLETKLAIACDDHLEAVCKAIEQQCEQEKMDRALMELPLLVHHLLAFKDVESFQVTKLFTKHEDCARKDVVGLVDRAQRYVRDVVSEKLFDDRAHHDTAALPALLKALRAAEYVEKLQPGARDRTVDAIVEGVGSEAYRYVAEVRKMPIQLNNLDILPKVANAIEKLNRLGNLSGVLPQAEEDLKLAKGHVEEGVTRIRGSVEQLFSDLPGYNEGNNEQQAGGNGALQLERDFSLRLRKVKCIQEFVDECTACRLSHLMPCIGNLEDLLNHCIEDYGKFVRHCFARVVNVMGAFVDDARDDLEGATKRLQTAGRVLQARLDEFYRLKEQLPTLYEQAFVQPAHELRELQDDAEQRETKCQELLSHNRLQELELQVRAAGILKMVDHDLCRPEGARTYKDVYNAYKDSLREQQGDMENKVREALDEKDFAQVAAALDGHKQLPQQGRRALKTSILSGVDGAHDTCISVANGLNNAGTDDLPGRFETLKASLQKLSGVRDLRNDHPDIVDDAKARQWEQALGVVSETVARVVNDECARVESLLARCSFADAARRLRPLPLCIGTVRPLLEGLEEASGRVHGLQGRINEGPEEALKSLQGLSLEDLCRSPPPLLKRLPHEGEELRSRAHGDLLAMVEQYSKTLEAADVLEVDETAVARTIARFKKLVPKDMVDEVEAQHKEIQAALEKKLLQRLDGIDKLLEKRKWDELGAEVKAVNKLTTEAGSKARERLMVNMDHLRDVGVDACDSDGQAAAFLDAVVVASKCRELGVPNANVVVRNLVQLARGRLEQRHNHATQLFNASSPLRATDDAAAASSSSFSASFSASPESPASLSRSDEVSEFVRATVQCLYLSKAVEVASTSVAPSPSGAKLSRHASTGQDGMRQEIGRMVSSCTERLEALRQDIHAITAALDSLQASKVAWTSFDGKAQLLGHQCRALAALGKALQRSSVRETLCVQECTVAACTGASCEFAARVADLETLVAKWTDESASIDLLDARVNVNTEEQQRAYDAIQVTQRLLGLAQAFAAEFADQAVAVHRGDGLGQRVDAQKREVLRELHSAVEAGDWERCDLLLSHLRLMQRVQPDAEAAQAVRSQVQAVQTQLQGKADAVLKQLRESRCRDEIAERLLELQAMADGVDCVSDHITTRVTEFLQRYDQGNKRDIPELGLKLEKLGSAHALRVLHGQPVFTGFMRRIINNKISSVSVEDALAALHKKAMNKLGKGAMKELEGAYREFKRAYDDGLRMLSDGPKAVDELAGRARLLAADVTSARNLHANGLTWTADMKDGVPKLLANIFCMWTLHHASDSGQVRDELLQPHPAQVLSIMRLLGIGTEKGRPQPHLVEVLTGEGKSVLLGALASVLALYGMRVSVACFSPFLSERDHRGFAFLFDKLGIVDRVEYGTFDQLCEGRINAKGDVRALVKYLLEKGKFPTPGMLRRLLRWAAKRLTGSTDDAANADDGGDADGDVSGDSASTEENMPHVLLLDEADVALDPSILSSTYAPNCQVTHDALQKLMLWLWKNRAGDVTLEQVKDTDEHKALLGAFSGEFHPLLESCTTALLQDLKTFKDHDYVFKDGRIGYKLHDSMSYKMRMRYKTVFALMHELEKQGVDVEASDAVRKELCFLLNCGEFSYFEVQKTFDLVLGVTGTLENLSGPEFEVLRRDYGVELRTVMPSMFGASKLKPFEAQDLQVVGQEHFLLTISQEVKKRHDKGLPVLVLFETERQLQEYLAHDSLQGMMAHVQVLSETLNSSEKEKIVRKATQQKRITLGTRSFGRGVDFQVRDPAIPEKGGMHVLQTFLAETMAEEKQIMGRTARQGEPGSYSVVLCREHLEVFAVQPPDVEGHESVKALQEYLWSKRDEAFARKFAQTYDIARAVKEAHDTSVAFLESLHGKKKEEVVKQLGKWNFTRRVMKAATRTLWALDLTCSMRTSLAKTMQVIGIVFERIEQILKEKGLMDNSDIALQLLGYRNYNTEADQLLQASPWEQNPSSLRQFLSGLSVNGGWGNEAIEVALARANTEKDVSQVILIGDAPANTPAEVTTKREMRGEKYWQQHGAFADATTADAELQKLKEKEVRVHCFYIKDRAKEFFEHAASVTGGRCQKLDIESEQGAEQLTNLVSEEMLRVVGGDQLVDTYRTTYCK